MNSTEYNWLVENLRKVRMNNIDQRAQVAADFGAYMHPVWGVVGLYKAGNETAAQWTCDNYHLFTALYFRMFAPLPGDSAHYQTFIAACRIQSGLYARFPGRITDISQDEVYGICSSIPMVAALTNNYGSTNWWSYNLTAPGKFTLDTFLGRFPCFVTYVKASASASLFLSPFWSLYWFFGFVASAWTNESETSGKNLSYLQIPIMKKYLFGRFAIAVWRWKMKRTYPGGMRDVCKIYFPVGHPFTIHAPEDFQ
jgi:hypothetical protein